MIAAFLIISILLSLALWIRPPSVLVGNPSISDNASAISITNNALSLQLDVNVSVNNPNYFSVELTDLQIDLFYPINNTAVGNGEVKNINFKPHADTNFTFPLDLTYNITDTNSYGILVDLAEKCGIISGSSTSDITIDYKIHLDVKVLYIPVKPVISSSFSFACPLSPSELEALLKEAGIDLGNLGSLKKRRLRAV